MESQAISKTRYRERQDKTLKLRSSVDSLPALKVSYAPQRKSTNPYQNLLEGHLSILGAQLQGVDVYEFFLPAATRKFNPDVIHLHWLDTFIDAKNISKSFLKLLGFIFGLIVLKIQGTKIVWTVHNLKNHESHPNRLRFLFECICGLAVAKLCHAIISHSEFASFQISSRFNLSGKRKIFIVPHGNYIGYYENSVTQTDARYTLGIPLKTFVYLFLGHIRPYKGVLELIQAFTQLDTTHSVHLVIAGEPLTKEIAEEIFEETSHHTNVLLNLHSVPDDKIQFYMNACDVVVFPYLDILTSGAMILAMSFGKACIAPRLGCIAETLDNNGSFLYEPTDENGLLKSLIDAKKNRSLAVKMGQHNLRVIEKNDWNLVALKTYDVYQRCWEK